MHLIGGFHAKITPNVEKMQRFLHKVVSHHHHHRQPNLSGFNNSHHRIYNHTSSGTAHIHTPKASPQGHRFHSWPSYHHNLSTKIRQCLSQPMLALHSRNALRRISTLDCSLRLPTFHFSVQRFSSSRNYESYGRRWRSRYDMLTNNDVLLGLIATNTAIFILWKIADEKFMINNFTLSLDNIKSGRLHTLITSVFSHADSWHITSNMFALLIFGLKVATKFGPDFMLKTYLFGAVGGSITSLLYLLYQALMAEISKKELGIIKRSKELELGASGAVYAVMLLDLFFFPNDIILFSILPVPTIMLGSFLIVSDMLRISKEDSGVSGAAQLGGATFAALVWAVAQLGRFR